MAHSNEIEMLVNQLGGPEEYRAAVIVASFLRLFELSLDVNYVQMEDKFTVIAHRIGAGSDVMMFTFRNTYKYLFEVQNE